MLRSAQMIMAQTLLRHYLGDGNFSRRKLHMTALYETLF
jgi:hypothetical protein